MRAIQMVLYMFGVSLLLGTFVTGMTPLAYDAAHYTISWTRVLMAWYMGSWMGAAEVVMSARMSPSGWMRVHTQLAMCMALSALASFACLRAQLFVTEAAWAVRMIEHHSTALTTSRRLVARCAGERTTLCTLAVSIAEAQADEISLLVANAPVLSISVLTGLAVAVVVAPVTAYQLRAT